MPTPVRHRAVGHGEALEAVAALGLLADDVKDGVDELGALGVVALGPVVARARLAEAGCPGGRSGRRARADRVHGAGLEVHEDVAGHVAAAGRLVVVHVDALELEVGVAVVGAGRVDAVLVGDDLPELGADLVAALATLDSNDLTHDCSWGCFCESGVGGGGGAVSHQSRQEPRRAHLGSVAGRGRGDAARACAWAGWADALRRSRSGRRTRGRRDRPGWLAASPITRRGRGAPKSVVRARGGGRAVEDDRGRAGEAIDAVVGRRRARHRLAPGEGGAGRVAGSRATVAFDVRWFVGWIITRRRSHRTQKGGKSVGKLKSLFQDFKCWGGVLALV